MLADSETVFKFIVGRIALHRKIQVGINQFSPKLIASLTRVSVVSPLSSAQKRRRVSRRAKAN